MTTEIARCDDESGDLLWRVSIADVVEEGPFSALPGIDRTITLIEGAGFDLHCGPEGGVLGLKSFEPVEFSGDWPTRAFSFRGASRDLNVMTARGKMSQWVVVMRDNGPLFDFYAGTMIFFVFDGDGKIFDEECPFPVSAGDIVMDDEVYRPNLFLFMGDSAAKVLAVSLYLPIWNDPHFRY